MNKARAYFLLDAVLGVLILSILVVAILYALELSIKGFRRVNEYIYTDNKLEDIFCEYLIAKNYPDLVTPQFQGRFYTPYQEFSWQIDIQEVSDYLEDIIINISRDSEIFSQGKYLFPQ